ncbi:DUF3152 domain-containing protein [Actinoplanes missouriensis]|uniref:DUF3152 domain-containing protein n=1 Tax=Actinoplanes missouriensis TaxID=1866 RepID=UPI001E4078D0|nr:DUF3152 domain-containing protein [Actinoplanes missouriensis]
MNEAFGRSRTLAATSPSGRAVVTASAGSTRRAGRHAAEQDPDDEATEIAQPAESTAKKSTAMKSTAAKSTATKSTATKSTAAKSTAAKSTTKKSTAVKASPAIKSTSAVKTSAVKSTSSRPPVDELPIGKTSSRAARKSTSATQPEPTPTPAKSMRRASTNSVKGGASSTTAGSVEAESKSTTRAKKPAESTKAANRAALAGRGAGPAKAVPENRATPARVRSVEAALEARAGASTKTSRPTRAAAGSRALSNRKAAALPEDAQPENTQLERTQAERTKPERTQPERTQPERTQPERTHAERTHAERSESERPEMTRGILELAAERLAASRPSQPAIARPPETPTPSPTSTSTPPPAMSTKTSMPTSDGDYEHGRPARGLPASLRLPAELPANLYVPPTREQIAAREEAFALHETSAHAEALALHEAPAHVESLTHHETPARVEALTQRETPEAAAWEGTPIWEEAPTRNHPEATPAHDDPQTQDDAWAYPVETQEDTTAERLYLPAAETDYHDHGFLPGAFARDERTDDERAYDDRNYAERGYDDRTDDERKYDARAYDHPAYDDEPSPDSTARQAAPDPRTRRTIRRRRRAVLLAYLMVVAGVLIVGHELRTQEKPLPPEPAGLGEGVQTPAPAPTQGIVPNDVGAQAPVEEETGEDQKSGEFRYAKSRGPMLGTAGKLHRFRVAVEETVDGTAPAEFAEVIDRTLGDERSWVSDGRLRLRRVTNAGNADFTIYLASAGTSEKMCATGGLHTEGFTSCRVPGQVIINVDRWTDAIPEYAEHVDEYRRYAINHEVGHELGHGHEACPGEGEKAPVMMPQTYGLKGCTRNAWPYLDGKRYAGEPAA